MKKIALLFPCLSLILICFVSYAALLDNGNTLQVKVIFETPIVIESAVPGHQLIEIKGCPLQGGIGKALLPVKGLRIFIPPQKEINLIEVIPGKRTILNGKYKIATASKPLPLKESGLQKGTYENEGFSPGEFYKFQSLQYKKGYAIAVIVLYPLQYNSKTGEAAYFESMSLRLLLKDKANMQPTQIRQKKDALEEIRAFVDNPEDLF